MPPGVCEMLERELGDRWLGMDNGEQDGRWSGSPRPAPGRFAHLLRFQRYFEHMDKTLGNKMAALVSLNYGHYFLRANCYTMLGAETAQALRDAQKKARGKRRTALEKAMASLSTFPQRAMLVTEEPWSQQGVRKLLCKNFLIYFSIEEIPRRVVVLGVVYARRDQLHQLKNLDF